MFILKGKLSTKKPVGKLIDGNPVKFAKSSKLSSQLSNDNLKGEKYSISVTKGIFLVLGKIKKS